MALYDETLRDGLQGPSVTDPSIEQKRRIVELDARLGVEWVNLGLPGASARAYAHAEALARHVITQRLPLQISCAARTLISDIAPIAAISQRLGAPVEVMAFLGTSDIRQLLEGWDLNHLLDLSSKAIRFAVAEGLPITFVTEDTTRSAPHALRPLFLNALDLGVSGLCLCDTVGHATAAGVRALVDWSRALIQEHGAAARLDWHGHQDRGLALSNALVAAEAGVDRVHGTFLGLGERAGNTPLELLLINRELEAPTGRDLTPLVEGCRLIASATSTVIDPRAPVVGDDAFRTATGVHAAAIIKARQRGDEALADRIYSAVPARQLGRRQIIELGHMSGLSAARYWLTERGLAAEPALCEALLAYAKARRGVLSEAEVYAFLQGRR
ncbi:LeuA family protein [Myxococcota bacterium]|nr:LeuA family protein [Myxococcota bacterium]MBU1430598.1 LeuA family protein [Myxococcota bacterium]MBU1896232.1 LeuA family protein [Myxococcota bacterium]